MTGNQRFESFGRKLDSTLGDVARKVEQESERAVRYLNDEVVPAIRSGSTQVMRQAAELLARLADSMDQQDQKPATPAPPTKQPDEGNPSPS